MNRTHIIIIVVIAIAMGVIVGSLNNTSQSVDFKVAFAHPNEEYKISGTLDREQDVIYNPSENHSLTTFYMTDKKGITKQVYLHESKPQGMEQSESIDLYGVVKDGEFHASKMLMKCPSKYNENKHLMGASQK